MNSEQISSYYQNGLYENFWTLLNNEMKPEKNNSLTTNEVYDILKAMSHWGNPVEKIQNMYSNGKFISFAENFIQFFVQHQEVQPEKLKSLLNAEFINSCILSSAALHRTDMVEFFNQFGAKHDLSTFDKHLKNFLTKHDYDAFELLLSACGSVREQSSVLFKWFTHPEWDLPYEQLSQLINHFDLDINATFQYYDNLVDTGMFSVQSFAHYYINQSGTKANQDCLHFIEQFGAKINLDKNIDYYRLMNNKHRGATDVFSYMKNNTHNSGLDILQRFETLLEHAHFQEKHITLLADIVMKSSNLVTYSQNSFYQTYFSNPLLQSSLIDKNTFLEAIFQADVSDKNKLICEQNNNSSNPVSFVLDTFLKQVNIQTIQFDKNPLLRWAELQDKNEYSSIMFNLLYDKFGQNIQHLSLNDVAKISNKTLLHSFEQKGIQIEKKQSFLKSFFGNKHENNETNHAITQDSPSLIKEAIVNSPVATEEKTNNFNHDLYKRVSDNDLQQYIQAILLNVEQFTFLCDTQSQMDNDHYMNTLLPKFLNKTVENYLYFATMNSEEAKQNALTQLQLLNKKTFSVLNDDIENAKENAQRENRVHTSIIKQYKG